MKFRSVSDITSQAGKAFSRFPLALIDAAVGTVVAVVIINRDTQPPPESILTDLLLTSLLGIPLLITAALFGEKRRWSRGARMGLQAIALLPLVGYFFSLPVNIDAAPEMHVFRFAFLLLGMHLLAAVVPFAGARDPGGFWQYNKTLFLRILTSLLYSGVLWSGLSIALQALEHLFNLEINPERYGELWVIVMGVFNTWFFVSGIPEHLESLSQTTDYPRGLKVFTQYILMPLVVIYLLILYAYMGKIIIEQSWPQGWVSKLILGFSITGILALLLVHPIRDLLENVWIRTVSTWYYIVLLPLDVLLVLAIWRRTADYGITVNRYIVIILGLWLVAITLYFVLSKSKNIKVIPASLCVLAFGTAYGPWGAFAVAENDQVGRLESLLAKNDILVNAKIRKAPRDVSYDDAQEISSMVTYLVTTHGTSALQRWCTVDLDTLGSTAPSEPVNQRFRKPRLVVEFMGVSYVSPREFSNPRFTDFSTSRTNVSSVEGFTRLVHLHGSRPRDTVTTELLTNVSCTLMTDATGPLIRIAFHGTIEDSNLIDLRPMQRRLEDMYGNATFQTNVPQEVMTASEEFDHVRAKILVYHLRHHRDPKSTNANLLEADLLLGEK